MAHGVVLLFIWALLAGCATTHERVTSAPIPAEVGWSRPLPVVESSAPPPVPERPPTAAEQVAPYEEGVVTTVKVPLGRPLLILLEPGETVDKIIQERTVIMPGEEASPWTITEGLSHTPPRPSITVQCTHAGLAQGIVVLTSKRVYLIDLKSVGRSPYRVVRWSYEPSVVTANPPRRLLPDHAQPQTFYGGYTWSAVQGTTPAWMPTQVVSDQSGNTYVLFPRYLSAVSAPLLRLITSNGPELVNYYMDESGTVYIVHGMFDLAELRVGSGETAEVVRITRGATVALQCPGDAQCPHWPAMHMSAR